jgi:hypothetical protein
MNRFKFVSMSGLITIGLLTVGLAGTAVAQDPPSRVARVSYMTGQVSFEPASVDQWTQASLNYPMTTGDNLYTDTGSRAVLRIGRNAIRLNAGTNFQFVNLSDQVVQVSINSGSLSLRIRNLFQGEVWEVDTPTGAVTLDHPGEYRVDADPTQNATMVTCRVGQAQVLANNQSFSVYQRQTAYFGPDGNPDIRDQNPNDDFDNFAYSRDRLEDVPPPQYVSQDLDGYEDLNANGSWRQDATYGPVWVPRVEVGWAPYQTGHWAWVEPWGWTWVDQASWGFAPFHYGRWANFGGSWGWCPGPVGIRPVYAPALVAFVGGGGFGISLGIGGGGAVGWFPLGPRDPFIPSYRVSDAYVRNVNISNTRITNINITNVNVTNINYMNRGVPGAVAVMPQQAFASAQSVQRARVQITPAQLQQVRVVGTAAPVVPVRASVLAATSNARAIAPPASIANRPVVARLAPPPAPVSFAAKQSLLAANPGRPVAPQQLQVIRQQTPAAAVAPGRAPVRAMNTAQVRPIQPVVTPGAVSGGFTAHAAQANQARPAAPAGQPGARPGVAPPGQPAGQPAGRAPLPVQQQRAPLAPQGMPQAGRPVPQAAPQVGRPAPQAAPQVGRPVPQAAPPVTRPVPQAAPQVVRPVPQAQAPRPIPQQAPAPRPVPQAAPRPAPQPVREQAPAPRPVPQAAQRPAPQPVREQAPAPRPVPQAAPRPAPQQVREQAPAPRPAPQQVRQQAPPPRPAPQAAPRPAPQPQRQPPPPQRPAPKEEEKKKN